MGHEQLQLIFIINHFFQSLNQSIDEFWFNINGLHFNRSFQVKSGPQISPKELSAIAVARFFFYKSDVFHRHQSTVSNSEDRITIALYVG